MHFANVAKTETLRRQLLTFMEDHVIPRHGQWLSEVHAGVHPSSFMDDLKAVAHEEGL